MEVGCTQWPMLGQLKDPGHLWMNRDLFQTPCLIISYIIRRSPTSAMIHQLVSAFIWQNRTEENRFKHLVSLIRLQCVKRNIPLNDVWPEQNLTPNVSQGLYFSHWFCIVGDLKWRKHLSNTFLNQIRPKKDKLNCDVAGALSRF